MQTAHQNPGASLPRHLQPRGAAQEAAGEVARDAQAEREAQIARLEERIDELEAEAEETLRRRQPGGAT